MSWYTTDIIYLLYYNIPNVPLAVVENNTKIQFLPLYYTVWLLPSKLILPLLLWKFNFMFYYQLLFTVSHKWISYSKLEITADPLGWKLSI